ncbi:MAG: DUF4184 family protein [Candidatus Zixiibacteriota bacterium]|nr:MAG: DUF4184 family protein [candidate division Zixibacteria bacterium]
MPLKQIFPRYFSLTGLMAGAVSPDLLYFLALDTTHRGISHSWSGLFIFCLPAGVIFSFAFHKLFKYQAILNMPGPIDRFLSGLALKRFSIRRFRQWLTLTYSVLFGALSHFFWDSFTNSQGEITRMIPFLLDYSTILGITWQNCTIVRNLSTVLGGILILIYIFKSPLLPEAVIEKSIFTSSQKTRFWLLGIAAATSFAIFVVFFKGHVAGWDLLGDSPRIHSFRTFGLAGWAGFYYFICGYALYLNLTKPDFNHFHNNSR